MSALKNQREPRFARELASGDIALFNFGGVTHPMCRESSLMKDCDERIEF